MCYDYRYTAQVNTIHKKLTDALKKAKTRHRQSTRYTALTEKIMRDYSKHIWLMK